MTKKTVFRIGSSICGNLGFNGFIRIILLVSLCILPGAASAQVLYGSLTGNVTDPSDAVVPGAQVQALNTAAGVSRPTTTASACVYPFTELPPGHYKVTLHL